MTITSPTRQSKGQTIGGEFAPHSRDDADIILHVLPGDTLRPVLADESKAFIENAFAGIDAAWLEAEISNDSAEAAVSEGNSLAHAEIIAFLQSDNSRDHDYIAIAKRILADRREGFAQELASGWTGPGELGAVKRQLAADYFRDRANTSFAAATDFAKAAEAAGRSFGAYDTFEQAAADLSGQHDFYTGE